jgi:hypothetical protein
MKKLISSMMLGLSVLCMPLAAADKKPLGKKPSLTFLHPAKIDRDEFMRSNRLMTGNWSFEMRGPEKNGIPTNRLTLGRETKTHWIADVHSPLFNYRDLRLYMIDGIKIRKTPAIQVLPAKKGSSSQDAASSWKPRTEGNRKPREYEVVAYGDGSELPKKWMHKDFGKPKVVTIQLDSSGRVRIGDQRVPFDKLAEKLYGLFPTKVIVRVSGKVPIEKIKELQKVISKEFFWDFEVAVTNDGD